MVSCPYCLYGGSDINLGSNTYQCDRCHAFFEVIPAIKKPDAEEIEENTVIKESDIRNQIHKYRKLIEEFTENLNEFESRLDEYGIQKVIK